MNTFKRENLSRILKFLPAKLSTVIDNAIKDSTDDLCEIRLKRDSPVVLIFTQCRKFITSGGRLTSFFSSDLIFVSEHEIDLIFNSLCEYSVHSHSNSIARGFITIAGGNRIGVYGTAITENGKTVCVRNIRGMNIRIAGSFDGVANDVANRLYSDKRVNTLICGPPSSGKTTMLRDLTKTLSDSCGCKIAVIDERNEMDGYNIGFNTDLLCGYAKPDGIEIAVRTLSPEIIVCDEIGNTDEIAKIIEGLNSGVNFIMTIHCSSYKELVKKPQFIMLKNAGAVDYCVMLGKSRCEIDSIKSVEEIENENSRTDIFGNCVLSDRSVHSLYAQHES